jgi:hypothetical protein
MADPASQPVASITENDKHAPSEDGQAKSALLSDHGQQAETGQAFYESADKAGTNLISFDDYDTETFEVSLYFFISLLLSFPPLSLMWLTMPLSLYASKHFRLRRQRPTRFPRLALRKK